MRMRTVATFLCLFFAYSYAEPSSPPRARRDRADVLSDLSRCMANVDTPLKKRMCAALEASRQEEAMQMAYDELLAATANDPEATEKAKAVQTAWIAAQPHYDSLPVIEVSLRRAAAAERQAAVLRELLQQYAAP